MIWKHPTLTGRGGLIGRTQAPHGEGRNFDSLSSKTSELKHIYFLPARLELSITRRGRGMCGSVPR